MKREHLEDASKLAVTVLRRLFRPEHDGGFLELPNLRGGVVILAPDETGPGNDGAVVGWRYDDGAPSIEDTLIDLIVSTVKTADAAGVPRALVAKAIREMDQSRDQIGARIGRHGTRPSGRRGRPR